MPIDVGFVRLTLDLLDDVIITSGDKLDHLEHDGTTWADVTDLKIKAGQKLIIDGG